MIKHRPMKRFLSILFVLLACLCSMAKSWTVQTLPNVQVKDRTKHLVNPDGIISVRVQSQIDSLLLQARQSTSAEIVAVMINDFDGDNIDDFATDLFNSWNIGKKDKNNGILILVAKNRRKATIRTGYGAEGIIPDITAGRILRNTMFPRFKQGDYEGGLLAGVKQIHEIVTNPEAAAELRSSQSENYDSGVDIDFFKAYLTIAISVAAAMLIVLICVLISMRKRPHEQKYQSLAPFRSWALVMSALCMLIPLVATVPFVLLLNYWRNHPRRCAKCGAKMRKIDEVHDNDYLPPVGDTEEKIKSIDYDVWLCPDCGDTYIIPYELPGSNFTECPQCHGRTCSLIRDSITKQPTASAEGRGERLYHCHHCGYQYITPYNIARLATPLIIPGGGFGGRGGGGGSFGGGFGGGFTGGGGASGGW